jgi:uncharacterized phiE125 gp8 family phage protein
VAVYEVVTPATELPVALTALKDHISYDADDRDAELAALLHRAVRHVEELAGVRLMATTVREYRDQFGTARWGCPIELAVGPVQSVSSITYVDEAGATQTLDAADYQVDAVSVPARVAPAWGQSWPLARRQFNSVAITYVVGVTDRADVPASAEQLVLLIAGKWFDGCEGGLEIDGAVHSLLLDLKGWANG